MVKITDLRARLREDAPGLLVAIIMIAGGTLLIHFSTNNLSANNLGQALIAYVGVFVVAVGILLVASTLLLPPPG